MSDSLLLFFVAALVAVALLVIFRQITLWYFKLDHISAHLAAQTELLKEVRSLLRVIARSEMEIRDLARGDDPPSP